MKVHNLSVTEALASLHSGENGLSTAEAQRRLEEFGRNVVQQVNSRPVILALVRELTHFFALILWLAAAMAFAAGFCHSGEGMAMLGFAIVGVIIINGAFSFWQTYRAERALAALQKLLPNQIKALRDGLITLVPAEQIVPGDVIALEAGDRIPADARVIQASALRVNNATVTGESVPHSRDPAPCDEPDYLHSRNILLAGTSAVSGEAKALVFATGSQTEFGQIARLTQYSREQLSPLQTEIARVSRFVALLALGIGLIFFLIGCVIGLSFWTNFIFAIGIIVANVPEGLLPTMTLALAMGSQRMARRKALIRHLPAVETLGCATIICTDKTGTLTLNKMSVKMRFVCGELRDARTDRTDMDSTRLFKVALRCETAQKVGSEPGKYWIGDPMEIALLEFASEILPSALPEVKVTEIPFDSRRKRLVTVHETGEGLIMSVKGAPEAVIPLCVRQDGPQGIAPLTDFDRSRIASAQQTMAESGLRVLAFAYRVIQSIDNLKANEQELVFAGLVGLEDPPRPEVPEAVAKCRHAGIKVIMITGDHPQTALSLAREINLIQSRNPRVITGDELRRISNIQLQLALDSPEILFARVAADQKLRIVTALKRKKHIVAVTGDGVNDAPALRAADIGIAMGICGTDVARESADMVLLDDNFSTIVAAIEEGRVVYANIRKFLTYILTSNIPELAPYLAFVLFRIPLPLTVIQILAVDLGTDMLPAIALGAEQPGLLDLNSPPRSPQVRLLNWPLLLRAYGFLGGIEAMAAMAAFFFVLRSGHWRWSDVLGDRDPLYLQATTACLSAIVLMQMVNVFLCRSRRQSTFGFNVFRNKLILAGVAIELVLILLIDYTPWGHAVFGTASLPATVWLFIAPFALSLLALEELRKALARFISRASRAHASASGLKSNTAV